jgi:TPR repeat protein
MSLLIRRPTQILLLALTAGLAAMPLTARAQSADGITASPSVGAFHTEHIEQSGEPKPELFRKGDATTPAPTPANPAGKDDVTPSSGVGLLDRMGADLPPLPPEKPFTGQVDEAYGAFQRGLYLTAFQAALPRAQLGDPAAQTLIAELLSQGLGVRRDTKNAAFWYSKAAEGGDATSMFKYALILIEGQDVPRDRKAADIWMKKAADAGQPSAEFNWGQSLTADNPGVKGLELALPYYEKSAELVRAANAGFDTAQLDMGLWLISGTGGPIDLKGGFNWMKVAAYRGNVVAQNKLAHLYINAIGTTQQPVEAATWYVISRRAGLKDPELEDFYLGIEDDQQKSAIDAANKYHPAK